MKINQYGTPIVSNSLSKSDSRRVSTGGEGETGATIRISTEARQLGAMQARMSGQGDIREDKIAEARAALADGSLDSDSAIEIAIDRIVADLF